MKTIAEELRYDAVTVDQVYAMLADPDFRTQVCAAQGVLSQEVEIAPDGAGMQVTVDQVHSADGIPSFARKVVGEEINIVQSELWSAPDAPARLQVTIPGKPGEMTGTITLVGDTDGVTEKVDLDVKVSIPLVGGKLESLIADMLRSALRAEHGVGVDWLRERA